MLRNRDAKNANSTRMPRIRSIRVYLLFCIALVILLTLAPSNWHVFAIDQMRTIETYVGDDTAALTNITVNKDFTIYIGNNISGIANPVKSVYFLVSGTYASTAVATLDLKIDSDAATLQQFSLPSTSATPTPFEILYKDPTSPGKINPASAGSYSFQLNITVPSAITVYGLGVKVMTTYRYAPVSCDDGQPANEKVKTGEYFVGDSDTAVTAQINKDFSIYIGDNLSGVTSPIKSVYFVVTGVYTGGAGSLELKIDSDAASSQVFALPLVSSPTPFEILYKDPANKINPASAGTFSYQLNVIPSSVTVYGFGAKVLATYRYKPPTCGGGLPVSGELTSSVFDTAVADGAAYNSIAWKGTLVSGTKVRFQLATSNFSAGPWSFVGGTTCGAGDWYDATNTDKSVETTCSAHNNNRYYRYKVQLCSSDCSAAGTVTSTVTDVNVSWSP